MCKLLQVVLCGTAASEAAAVTQGQAMAGLLVPGPRGIVGQQCDTTPSVILLATPCGLVQCCCWLWIPLELPATSCLLSLGEPPSDQGDNQFSMASRELCKATSGNCAKHYKSTLLCVSCCFCSG